MTLKLLTVGEKMSKRNAVSLAKKRASIYLFLVLGVCFFLGFLSFLLPNENGSSVFNLLQKGFTVFPVLAALFTRILTKDKSSWNIDLRVWKNKKLMLFSAFLPGAAVIIGAGIYYVFFPNELQRNIQSMLIFCMQYGLPSNIGVNFQTIFVIFILLWLVSALAIPIHLLELGEEIGWRGYLLPQLLCFLGKRKAAILSGIFWGVAHTPLIYFGFNYGEGYWGAPYTGILLMIVFCVGIGIWMSYTMIETKNCMYSAMIHGAINVAADIQILSIVINRPLLGPAPTGIIGMSIILLVSIALFVKSLKTQRT